jgi:hypothetical protein
MARNRELIGSILLASGILFTVAGAAALIAGQPVVGVVLLAIGLSDVVARFVIVRGPSRPARRATAEPESPAPQAGEAAGAEPSTESTEPSYNPYARED